ncbi:MAG: hypothetical protein IIY88_01820 [Eubacterium sp.]|nr:hypothetical protein [Eubacterium sp.]
MTTNKKGSEIVEAAIVLPVLILSILSMLMLLIYEFSALTGQIDMHKKLTNDAVASKRTFHVLRETENASKDVSGIISIVLKKEIKAVCYEICEAKAMLLGEVISDG